MFITKIKKLHDLAETTLATYAFQGLSMKEDAVLAAKHDKPFGSNTPVPASFCTTHAGGNATGAGCCM